MQHQKTRRRGFLLIGFGGILLAVLVAIASRQKGVDYEIMRSDRQKVEAWCSIRDDELQDLDVRRAARENCDRMRAQFRNTWGHNP